MFPIRRVSDGVPGNTGWRFRSRKGSKAWGPEVSGMGGRDCVYW